MIYGQVTSRDEAVIKLRFYDDQDRRTDIDAVMDTGFTDYLSLPRSLIGALNCMPKGADIVTMANGRSSLVTLYDVKIFWNGEIIDIVAHEMGDRPLIGMKLLRGCLVTMEVTPDGEITIESIE